MYALRLENRGQSWLRSTRPFRSGFPTLVYIGLFFILFFVYLCYFPVKNSFAIFLNCLQIAAGPSNSMTTLKMIDIGIKRSTISTMQACLIPINVHTHFLHLKICYLSCYFPGWSPNERPDRVRWISSYSPIHIGQFNFCFVFTKKLKNRQIISAFLCTGFLLYYCGKHRHFA
jgi:hypothetical protein